MTKMLIPNLPENKVVMYDNAQYHSIVIDKVPNSGNTKQQMENWLMQQNIPYRKHFISLSKGTNPV